ncbi:MAG: hypothetical protein C0442_11355, partial [Chlorobiaceae bacterium]|nr:hypothetical protein [Chlorobiaceae bacterium]
MTSSNIEPEINLGNDFKDQLKMLENISLPLYVKDLHGKFLGCNKSFEKLLGKRKEEIVNK